MRKFIMLLLLAMVSSGAAAEWVAMGSADSGDTYFDIYVDPTIHKSGNMVQMWVMFDFKTVQVDEYGRQYLSDKAQHQYDCKDERSRTLYFTLHSGNMGHGNVVYLGDGIRNNWIPISSDSISEGNWKIACGKQ